jgi:signal transduction histidine kinase
VALLDDRDTIARDMHDHVIQRLFATGLSLQSASRLSAHPGVQPRIEEAVDEIDAAIKEIRQAIYRLRRSVKGVSAGEELQALVASFAPGLGFAPALDVDGDIEMVGLGCAPTSWPWCERACPRSRGTPADSRRRCTSRSTSLAMRGDC